VRVISPATMSVPVEVTQTSAIEYFFFTETHAFVKWEQLHGSSEIILCIRFCEGWMSSSIWEEL
jgi:hypothetical protein